MKKILALSVALCIFIIGANTAFAVEFLGGEELYIEKLSFDDVYAGGGLVTVNKDVEGDLVVGGGSVTINANVKGDLIIGGGQITINGDVADDVRVAGGSITLNGNVGDDLIASGGQLSISNNSLIGGSLVFGVGFANVLGNINENVIGGGGKLILGGTVYGDVEAEIQDSLTLLDNARIEGNLIYTSLREAKVNKEQVAGFVEFNKTVVEDTDIGMQVETIFSRLHLIFQILKYLSLLALGLVLVLLLPKALLDGSEIALKKPWANLGIGFIIAICAIAAMIIISVTVIGIPIALILLGIFLITWYVAKVYAAMFIGRLLIKPKKMTKGKMFGIIALGGFIIMVIGIVPIIGWLVAFLITMIAFGSLWSYKKQIYDKIGFNKF